jgi:hypothetical protein
MRGERRRGEKRRREKSEEKRREEMRFRGCEEVKADYGSKNG